MILMGNRKVVWEAFPYPDLFYNVTLIYTFYEGVNYDPHSGRFTEIGSTFWNRSTPPMAGSNSLSMPPPHPVGCLRCSPM